MRCVGMMRLAGLKGQPVSEVERTDQTELMARMLSDYSPQAVSEGCKQWVQDQKFWPAVSEIRKIVAEHQALIRARQPALTGPNGESFTGRLQRLGIPVTDFGGTDYDRWSPLMGHHQGMSDAQFLHAIDELKRPHVPFRRTEGDAERRSSGAMRSAGSVVEDLARQRMEAAE